MPLGFNQGLVFQATAPNSTARNIVPSTTDVPAQEQERRARLEYQRRVQEKLRAQTSRMLRAKQDLDRRQEQQDKQLAKEKQRQATWEWWKTPSSSSSLGSLWWGQQGQH